MCRAVSSSCLEPLLVPCVKFQFRSRVPYMFPLSITPKGKSSKNRQLLTCQITLAALGSQSQGLGVKPWELSLHHEGFVQFGSRTHSRHSRSFPQFVPKALEIPEARLCVKNRDPKIVVRSFWNPLKPKWKQGFSEQIPPTSFTKTHIEPRAGSAQPQ